MKNCIIWVHKKYSYTQKLLTIRSQEHKIVFAKFFYIFLYITTEEFIVNKLLINAFLYE